MSTNINTVIEKLELAVAEINRGQLASQNRADYGRLLSGAHAAEREIKGALDRLQAQQPNAEPVDMIHNDYDASVKCSNCGTDGGFGVYDDLDWAKFCPGCGRPIARQIDAKGNVTPHPLYAHPPASTEPRLTVEQAMEVVHFKAEEWFDDNRDEWRWRVSSDGRHIAWQQNKEAALSVADTLNAHLRDRLTKAAKP